MEHCLGSKFGPKLCARNLGQTGIRPVCSRNASATETSAQVYNNDENNADFRTLISMKIIIGVFLIYGSDICWQDLLWLDKSVWETIFKRRQRRDDASSVWCIKIVVFKRLL